jgi:hypothetical protein
MNDTPRTDARVFSVGVEVRGHDGEPQTEYVDVVYEGFARELERELAKANAERDEARRMYCEARYREERADLRSTPTSPHVIADERGWDCFAPHATDVRVQNGGEP